MWDKYASLGFPTYENLSEKIESFQYGRLDLKSRVPNIFTNRQSDSKKLSASHFWTFIRILPLIYGEELKTNEYFNHYLDLIEIFFLINDHTFTEVKIQAIEKKVAAYLSQFKILYPNESISAKFHFMVHYGRAIREYGPPRQYSTMRFESKHATFKRFVAAIHNHKNFTKTLSEKHQHLQLFHLLSPNYFSSNIFGSRETKIDSSSSDIISSLLFDGILKDFKIENCSKKITYFKWVIFDLVEYTIGDLICFENKQELPTFGKIKHLIVHEDNLYFFLDVFTTVTFRKYQMGYLLEENLNRLNRVQPLKTLKNKIPMDIYKMPNGDLIVSPKYSL